MTLASYAANASQSRGRLHPEPASAHRTAFQRDRDRIVHSTAFRRLKHKTQVFVAPEGDHYRTRLTHSLEVAQIARSMARTLGLDEDLTEAISLAHDIGHPPFGHAGEDELDTVSRPFGGFDHNDQTVRVLTDLERKYPAFDGLNLSWECLEGIVKHNGPVAAPPPNSAVGALNDSFDLALDTYPSAEAQVAALADDIAYCNHDLDDGLRANILNIRDLEGVPHVNSVVAGVRAAYPAIDESRIIHEAVRRMIGDMVEDVLTETARRLSEGNVATIDDIRRLDRPVVAFSEAMREKERILKRFLFTNLYRHPAVERETESGRQVVRGLFACLMEDPLKLPPEWRDRAGPPETQETAHVVINYIAGMTDRFARDQFIRLT